MEQLPQLNIKFEMILEITYTLIVWTRGLTEDEEGKIYTANGLNIKT